MNENRNIVKKAEEAEEGKGAKKRGNSQFQLFMVTQELSRHIGNTAAEINHLIEERVGENLQWSYTGVHDGDTSPVWDFERKVFCAVEKLIHAHSVLRVKKKMTINALAKLIGVEPQYIERPKAGHGAESKMLAYLVHARDADKRQYDPRKVVGSRDAVPYEDIYCRHKYQWDRDRAKNRTAITAVDEDYLMELIENGEIVDKNQILLTDEYYRVYSRHPRKIDKALEIASMRRQVKNAQAIKDGQLKQAIYITGAPGNGKSYLCEKVIEEVQKTVGDGWLVCDANSENCLDKYNGEEILFIDDARGNAMTANQWARLLDPRRVNEGSARYHDRLVSSRLIIFNSYYSIDEFFYFTRGVGERDKSEALDQFIRRILIRITVNGRDDIDLAVSDAVPSERYIEHEDRYGYIERIKIATRHSFVTICEHQTARNIAALAAGIVAANQHAGEVTDAMMTAAAKVGVALNDVGQAKVLKAEAREAGKEISRIISVPSHADKILADLKDRTDEAERQVLLNDITMDEAYLTWVDEHGYVPAIDGDLTDEDRAEIREIQKQLLETTAAIGATSPAEKQNKEEGEEEEELGRAIFV